MAKVLVIKYSSCQVNPIFQKTEKPRFSMQVRNYGKEINYEMKVVYREADYPNDWNNYCLHENGLEVRINLDRAEINVDEIKSMMKKLINDIESGLSSIELLKAIDDLYYDIFKPSHEPSLKLDMSTIGGDYPIKELEIIYY